MRKLIITLTIFIVPLFAFSQQKVNEAISTSIRILKVHESSLDQLSPFDEVQFEQIMRLNRKVKEELLKLLQLEVVLDFPKDSIPFFNSQSASKDFAIFNWQENLGGTFHQYINILYWANQKGNPQVVTLDEEYAPFGEIFEIKNARDQKLYLILGGGKACLTCIYERALLLNTRDETLENVFTFEINYQFNNDIKGLNFDAENQILNYEFIEEECEDDDGENCWVRGQFKFDGKTFIEIED